MGRAMPVPRIARSAPAPSASTPPPPIAPRGRMLVRRGWRARVHLGALLAVAVQTLGTFGCGGASMPASALVHNDAGAALLAEGALDRAEARLRLALEFAPHLPEAWANLGLVSLARGALEQAEGQLRAALSLREDFPQAWGDLGVVLERRGRDDEARAAYARALALDPARVLPRAALARSLARSGQLEAARAQLLRLVELAPDDAESAGLLAWCELRLGRPTAAGEVAASALERVPDAAAPRLVRGVLRARDGDLDASAADLEAVLGDPVLGREAAIRLAAVGVFRGRAADALAAMESLLRATPDDPAVRLVAARAALVLGEAERAVRHAQTALALAPDLAAARHVLVEACRPGGVNGCPSVGRPGSRGP